MNLDQRVVNDPHAVFANDALAVRSLKEAIDDSLKVIKDLKSQLAAGYTEADYVALRNKYQSAVSARKVVEHNLEECEHQLNAQKRAREGFRQLIHGSIKRLHEILSAFQPECEQLKISVHTKVNAVEYDPTGDDSEKYYAEALGGLIDNVLHLVRELLATLSERERNSEMAAKAQLTQLHQEHKVKERDYELATSKIEELNEQLNDLLITKEKQDNQILEHASLLSSIREELNLDKLADSESILIKIRKTNSLALDAVPFEDRAIIAEKQVAELSGRLAEAENSCAHAKQLNTELSNTLASERHELFAMSRPLIEELADDTYKIETRLCDLERLAESSQESVGCATSPGMFERFYRWVSGTARKRSLSNWDSIDYEELASSNRSETISLPASVNEANEVKRPRRSSIIDCQDTAVENRVEESEICEKETVPASPCIDGVAEVATDLDKLNLVPEISPMGESKDATVQGLDSLLKDLESKTEDSASMESDVVMNIDNNSAYSSSNKKQNKSNKRTRRGV